MVGEMDNNEIPFDMAKETLKSIRSWIDKITQLSLCIIGGDVVPVDEMIRTKRDMVRQLIVLASPMIEKDIEGIQKFFNNIRFNRGDVKIKQIWFRNIIVHSYESDCALDECVKKIQVALKKYFVPSYRAGERY